MVLARIVNRHTEQVRHSANLGLHKQNRVTNKINTISQRRTTYQIVLVDLLELQLVDELDYGNGLSALQALLEEAFLGPMLLRLHHSCAVAEDWNHH